MKLKGKGRLKIKYILLIIIRDKTMADNLIYTHNDDTQNYPFCILQLIVDEH